jgi:hypothetical protein
VRPLRASLASRGHLVKTGLIERDSVERSQNTPLPLGSTSPPPEVGKVRMGISLLGMNSSTAGGRNRNHPLYFSGCNSGSSQIQFNASGTDLGECFATRRPLREASMNISIESEALSRERSCEQSVPDYA